MARVPLTREGKTSSRRGCGERGSVPSAIGPASEASVYSEESRQAPEASDARLQPARSPIKATGKESIHQRDVPHHEHDR